MDSSGIGFIIGRYNQLRSCGGKIFLTNLNELLGKIVRLSGVYKLVSVKNDEDEVNNMLEEDNGKVYEREYIYTNKNYHGRNGRKSRTAL